MLRPVKPLPFFASIADIIELTRPRTALELIRDVQRSDERTLIGYIGASNAEWEPRLAAMAAARKPPRE